VYIGTQPAIGQNRKLDSIAASFNGVLTTFNLTVNTASIVPSNVYQLFISLGGVLQNPGVDFTANGNQITFTTAPTAGLSFFGIFQGDSITGTPTIADASITTLKLATGLTVTHTAGTAAVPSITFSGDLANGAFAPAANTFGISTAGTERLRIDSSGRLLVGTSTARSNFFGTTLSSLTQTEGTGGSTARGALSVINNDVSNNPPYVLLGRSGAATLGSNAAVVSGSRLGTLTFHGADGTSFIEAATVAGEVDGTPGTNDMPGRLVFSTTADGAASPTERMRIKSDGQLNTLSSVGGFYSTVTAAAGTTIPTFTGRRSGTTLDNGTDTCYIWSNGNIQNVNGSYTAISDQKLKENIADANSQWNDLKAIQIRNWNFKEETGHETHRQIGPIAQELEQVCPGLVFETPDRDADGNETGEVTKGVNQSVLYMKAVKALQEAMERIEALEADVAQLKGA